MDIFERASRASLRFASDRGDLTTEQLWGLPLVAPGGRLSLDGLARAVNARLRSVQEEGFVDTKPDPIKTELELSLDILKHIIASKKADAARADTAAATRQRRERLLAALQEKEASELTSKSKEDIMAELASMDASDA